MSKTLSLLISEKVPTPKQALESWNPSREQQTDKNVVECERF